MATEQFSGISPAREVPHLNKNLRKFNGTREYIENLGLADLNSLDKHLLASYDPELDLTPVSMFTCEVDYDNRLIPGIFVLILGFSKQFSGRALLKRVETYINFREGIKQRLTLLVNEKIPELEDIEIEAEDIPLEDDPPNPRTRRPGDPRNPYPELPPGVCIKRTYNPCDTDDRKEMAQRNMEMIPVELKKYNNEMERFRVQREGTSAEKRELEKWYQHNKENNELLSQEYNKEEYLRRKSDFGAWNYLLNPPPPKPNYANTRNYVKDTPQIDTKYLRGTK